MGDQSNYSFTIKNNCGYTTGYALVNTPPTISPPPPAGIQTNVIAALNGVPSPYGRAYLRLSCNLFFAICGVAIYDNTGGARVEILDYRAISVGNDSGVLGTNCQVTAANGQPCFANDLTASAGNGCFAITTNTDFTVSQAKSQNFVLGLGILTDSTNEIGPWALFTPAPNVTYQISPNSGFYVTTSPAQYTARSSIPSNVLRNSLLVDFDALGTDSVVIIHNENGVLSIVSNTG